ncbi:MAG: 4Fe-4S dicluster domain-containing protein [Myxococcota bacterium]
MKPKSASELRVESSVAQRNKLPMLWSSLDEKRLVDSDEANRNDASFGDTTIEPYTKRSSSRSHTGERSLATEEGAPAGFVNASMLVKRRSFLQATGLTAAAGAAGCIRRPKEKILPYSVQPEYVVPGVPMHYATAVASGSGVLGLLVTTHEGRPTKVDGNPNHPMSLGATGLFEQSSILDLYDSDRSQKAAKKTDVSMADCEAAEVEAYIRSVSASALRDRGRGLRVLSGTSLSPSYWRLREALLQRFPEMKFYQYDAVSDWNVIEGAEVAFGSRLRPVYNLNPAKVILSLDADFLGEETSSVRNSRAFSQGRHVRSTRDTMNRLYVVEPTLSVTGMKADHRLRAAARDVERLLVALVKELAERHGLSLREPLARAISRVSSEGFDASWLRVLAQDLAQNRGSCPILVGHRQPARVHALAHFLNASLGNQGRTVGFAPVLGSDKWSDPAQSIAEFTADLRSGVVRDVLLLGGNPAYDAPCDAEVSAALAQQNVNVLHLSTHRNETTSFADWHLPQAHFLETWGDLQAEDGTRTVQQPLIDPLFGGLSEIEVLAQLLGEEPWSGHEVVRRTFQLDANSEVEESRWRRALHGGVVPGSRQPLRRAMGLQIASIADSLTAGRGERRALGRENFEVLFSADPKLLDGRFANNVWLQELPDPITKLVWDNAALISPAAARELGLSNGDQISLSCDGAEGIELPIFIQPGQAEWTLTLRLGWGRTAAGVYGTNVGFDVNPLRTLAGFEFGDGVRVTTTSAHHDLVQTQVTQTMAGRPVVIDATLDAVDAPKGHALHGLPVYKETPDFAQYRAVEFTPKPLWNEVDYSKGYKWGMTVDLTSCSGCNACVIACQAENNIPCVGKREVARGREMHWLRIDRYYVGTDEDDPVVALQPVGCQHCEEAPCENVCPVNATVHSPEGLNDMAYNRCVGTRYCANNCPYKVRRFNYLDWHDSEDLHGELPELRKMQFNPNVTVRMRGVIEKCSYCVQRIEEARIAARREKRSIRDGDVTPACAQTCPSQSIVFGDLNDPGSRVSKLASLDRQYRLLAEVGAQPRTRYLGQIRNPNPAMFVHVEQEAEG